MLNKSVPMLKYRSERVKEVVFNYADFRADSIAGLHRLCTAKIRVRFPVGPLNGDVRVVVLTCVEHS